MQYCINVRLNFIDAFNRHLIYSKQKKVSPSNLVNYSSLTSVIIGEYLEFNTIHV